jgi:hypothetical protein
MTSAILSLIFFAISIYMLLSLRGTETEREIRKYRRSHPDCLFAGSEA